MVWPGFLIQIFPTFTLMYGFLLFFGGVVVGVVIEHFFFKKDAPCDEDDSEKIQALTDKVGNIIEDIQNTV